MTLYRTHERLSVRRPITTQDDARRDDERRGGGEGGAPADFATKTARQLDRAATISLALCVQTNAICTFATITRRVNAMR